MYPFDSFESIFSVVRCGSWFKVRGGEFLMAVDDVMNENDTACLLACLLSSLSYIL
jgi:hypothetical protein